MLRKSRALCPPTFHFHVSFLFQRQFASLFCSHWSSLPSSFMQPFILQRTSRFHLFTSISLSLPPLTRSSHVSESYKKKERKNDLSIYKCFFFINLIETQETHIQRYPLKKKLPLQRSVQSDSRNFRATSRLGEKDTSFPSRLERFSPLRLND